MLTKGVGRSARLHVSERKQAKSEYRDYDSIVVRDAFSRRGFEAGGFEFVPLTEEHIGLMSRWLSDHRLLEYYGATTLRRTR